VAAVLLTRALVAAVVAVVLFALKAVTIAAGRRQLDDPVISLFFLAGLVALLVTFGLTGAALARRPGTRGRLAGAAVGLAVGAVGSAVIVFLATTLLPADGWWVWGEVNLWVTALLTLTGVLVLRSRADVRPLTHGTHVG